MTAWMNDIVWLGRGDEANPFAFDVLDCRPAVAALAQAEAPFLSDPHFTRLAEDIGARESASLPHDGIHADCCLQIAAQDFPARPAKLLSSANGDKWTVRVESERIVFTRRRTGQTIHSAEFSREADRVSIRHIASQKEFVQGYPAFAIAQIDFLLKTYIAGQIAPFPIPPALTMAAGAKIAVYGWKTHGPAAKFARALPTSPA